MQKCSNLFNYDYGIKIKQLDMFKATLFKLMLMYNKLLFDIV